MAEHQADTRRQFNMLPIGFKGFREAAVEDDPESSAQAALRKSVLQSLVEPPKPSEDIPPARLPTKEEKELIKLSLTLEHVKIHSSTNTAASVNAANGLGLDTSSLVVGEEGTNSYLSPPGKEGAQGQGANSSKKRGGTGGGLNASLSTPTLRKGMVSPPSTRGGGAAGAAAGRSTRSPAIPSGGRTKTPPAPVNSSTFFGGDSSVLMSSFGGPSLWSVPGERDIFGNQPVTSLANAPPEIIVPPAFSEASLKTLRRDNLIDVEGHTILRRLAASSDRVQVYDRSQPTLLVRSASMSTSVSLPALDSMRRTEISFGSQKVSEF